MKTVFFLALIAFATAVDHYDLEKIDLSDPSTQMDTLKEFMDCLNDKTSCNPIYQSYKDLVPDALKHSCGKCTPDQKSFAKQVLDTVKEKLPDHFDAFKKKYDPDGKLVQKLHEAVDKA